MKRKSIVNILLLVLGILVFAGCGTGHSENEPVSYTCPMHPQIVQDGPGQCPICGMNLVPRQAAHSDSLEIPPPVVNEPTLAAESGTRIFSLPVEGIVGYDTRKGVQLSSRVAGRIEKLYVRYNYQPVKKGQVIMEVYAPDLVAAQRELLYISREGGDATLVQRARQKLYLMGMQPAQVSAMIRSGRPDYSVPVYSPVSGYIVADGAGVPAAVPPPAITVDANAGMDNMGAAGSTPALPAAPAANTPVLVREGQYLAAGSPVFTIYKEENLVAEFFFPPHLAPYISRGQRMTYHPAGEAASVNSAVIHVVEPVVRAGVPFTVVRLYLAGSKLRRGQLLEGRIPVVARGWWLPESALAVLGGKSVVFKKEPEGFVAKEVPVGIRAEGLVQVTDSIGGWQVARQAGLVLDNETFITTGGK